MPIINAQVHAYEHNHPARPWAGHLHGLRSVTGTEMVAAMDAVGIPAGLGIVLVPAVHNSQREVLIAAPFDAARCPLPRGVIRWPRGRANRCLPAS